jgi:hypothetical protein
MTMKIEQFLKLPPETLTIFLSDGRLGDNLGFAALTSPGVFKEFTCKRIKTTSFDDVIFENKQWVVRGDATIDQKIGGKIGPQSYQADGDDILDGCHQTGRVGDTWPYHVCQKEWVDKQAFCDAYAVAWYHKNMSKARAELNN